jgi:hypothetical protein
MMNKKNLVVKVCVVCGKNYLASRTRLKHSSAKVVRRRNSKTCCRGCARVYKYHQHDFV